jgi:hypothetical protein
VSISDVINSAPSRPSSRPSVKSSIALAALFVLVQLCVELNFCNLLFLTILFHVLDMCNDDDMLLFTKKTFAAGQQPTTPRKLPLRPPSMLAFTAMALAFHLISKASRPEFEIREALERAQDRDRPVHGQHSR